MGVLCINGSNTSHQVPEVLGFYLQACNTTCLPCRSLILPTPYPHTPARPTHLSLLQVVFYLQTCTPACLPPMYRLFYSESPPIEQLRLLAPGSAIDPDVALATAHTRWVANVVHPP